MRKHLLINLSRNTLLLDFPTNRPYQHCNIANREYKLIIKQQWKFGGFDERVHDK